MKTLRWPFLGLPVFAAFLLAALWVESGNRAVGSIGGQGYDVLWAASWLGFPAVGALILTRRGSHPIGWIMYAVGGFLMLGLFANGVAVRHAFVRPVPIAGPVFTWLAFWIFVPAFGLPSLFLWLFPSGRAEGVWPRRFLVAATGTLGALLAVNAIRPTQPLDGHGLAGQRLVNPLGIAPLDGFLEPAVAVLSVAMAGCTVLAILDAVRRLFRAAPVERKQLKWVAAAVVPFPVLMTAASRVLGGRHNDLFVALAFFIALNGLAVAVLIAITRHRLYDIDRVVSRALAWTVLTAALVGLYLAGVLAATQVLQPLGVSGDLAVAASTLTVAAVFTPLRKRVQSLVDRRFDRARYDAARTVERFRASLRSGVQLEELSTELLDTVRSTVAPVDAGLWLRRMP